MTSTENPFLNPSLLHPELAANIANTTAWQVENFGADAEVAVSGLAQAVSDTYEGMPPEFSAEQRAFAKELELQLTNSSVYANNMLQAYNTTKGDEEKQSPTSDEVATQLFHNKLREWTENGALDYAMGYLAEHGGKMQLVATPNITVKVDDIEAIADAYNTQRGWSGGWNHDFKDETEAGHVWMQRGVKPYYNGLNLSGDVGVEPIRFSLIPTIIIETASTSSIDLRQTWFDERAKCERVTIPSVLEAVAYWENLDIPDEALKEINGAWEVTDITFLDVATQTNLPRGAIQDKRGVQLHTYYDFPPNPNPNVRSLSGALRISIH